MSDIGKRKKRRTRKCLDEIRKRSRRAGSSDDPNLRISGKAIQHINSKPNNNLITVNRLTLSMFPKAVQSETITRPALEKLNNKKEETHQVLCNILLKSSSSSIEPDDINHKQESSDAICNFESSSLQKFKKSDSKNKNEGSSYKMDIATTPKSFILFSPTDKSTPSLKLNNITSRSSMSSLTSENQYSDEIMNEVSKYCKYFCSKFVHEDVTKKSKEHLQKLYIESCQKEYGDNILKCLRNNAKADSNLMAGPRQIISYNNMINNYAPSEGKCSLLKEYSVSLSESPDCAFSPSANSSDKDLSVCSPCTIFSPPHSISDTPEYIFYPHRLNEHQQM